MGQTGQVLLVLGILWFYFIPSIGAYWDKKRNKGAILLLNFFLGWTVIGWIVAAIWAATKDTPPVAVVEQNTAPMPDPLLCAHCGKYSVAASKFCSSCGVAFALAV